MYIFPYFNETETKTAVALRFIWFHILAYSGHATFALTNASVYWIYYL